MPYATKDGVRLFFDVTGSGEPLLLLPGQGSDHHFWDRVRSDFENRHQVIVFDPRGTGLSDKPDQPPYSTQGFAEDAVTVLDHLGIARAHACGISMGGRVCQWLAIDHAARMGAVILGCTAPGNRHGVRRPGHVDALFHQLTRDPSALDRMAELLCSPQWIARNPGFLDHLRGNGRAPNPPFAQRLHYLASEAHDAWDRLPDIKRPVLVIHGSDDLINMTGNAKLLAQRIPGAELKIITGGRHLFFEEFREESSRAVLDFLARHPLN